MTIISTMEATQAAVARNGQIFQEIFAMVNPSPE